MHWVYSWKHLFEIKSTNWLTERPQRYEVKKFTTWQEFCSNICNSLLDTILFGLHSIEVTAKKSHNVWVLKMAKSLDFSLNHLHSFLVLYEVLDPEDLKSALLIILVGGKLYYSLSTFTECV